MEESWVGIRVAEGIDVPANPGSDPKFIFQKLVAEVHIVDHIFVMRSSFVMHAPASVYYFKSSVRDELLDLILGLLVLASVPHVEEFHFNVSELPVFVLFEFFYHSRYYQVNLSRRSCLIRTDVVLVNRLNPADIIVGMSQEMNI